MVTTNYNMLASLAFSESPFYPSTPPPPPTPTSLPQVYLKAPMILNGVCVIWRGWIDLQRLDGMGYLEYDLERAQVVMQFMLTNKVLWKCVHTEKHQMFLSCQLSSFLNYISELFEGVFTQIPLQVDKTKA